MTDVFKYIWKKYEKGKRNFTQNVWKLFRDNIVHTLLSFNHSYPPADPINPFPPTCSVEIKIRLLKMNACPSKKLKLTKDHGHLLSIPIPIPIGKHNYTYGPNH